MEQPEIAIYQPFYDAISRSTIDACATPLDWMHNPDPALRESAIYLHLAENIPAHAGYFGLFSSKYAVKSPIALDDFIKFVHANPGRDVYFINPFPHLAHLNFNVWDQGESHHPGLIETARKCFERSSILPPDTFDRRHDQQSAAFCNFWIATPAFFEHFVDVLSKLLSEPDPGLRNLMFGETVYRFRPAPLFPFIAERLFSSIVATNPKFSYLAYPFTRQQILDGCSSRQERHSVDWNMPWIDQLDASKQWTRLSRDQINRIDRANEMPPAYFSG